MKSTNTTFFKTIRAIVIIFALIFSSNSFATGDGDRDRDNRGRENRDRDNRGRENRDRENRDRDYEDRDHEDRDYEDRDHEDRDHGGTTSVPLDGGLGILVLGAAAFGVKKLRDNKNGTI